MTARRSLSNEALDKIAAVLIEAASRLRDQEPQKARKKRAKP